MKNSEYVKIVKDYGENALGKVLIRVVVRKLPFLATGPLNYILIKLASWLAVEAVEEAEIRVFFVNVDFRTGGQSKDFDAAMIKNHTIQKVGTDEEKARMEAELAKALNAAVHFKQ